MRTNRFPAVPVLALSLAFLAPPVCAHASGTYRGAPVQGAGALDTPKYELGKRLFAGEVTGTAAAADARQLERLQQLQGRLPLAVRKRANLGALAGRLATEQLEALEYFLKVRYRVA